MYWALRKAPAEMRDLGATLLTGNRPGRSPGPRKVL